MAIFPGAAWSFGLLLDVEGKVVVGFETTLLDNVEDAVAAERYKEKNKCKATAADDDAEGDSVVCVTKGAFTTLAAGTDDCARFNVQLGLLRR